MTTTNFLFEEKTGTEYEGALMWSCKRHSTVELYKETAGTEVDTFEGTDCIIEGVRVDFTHAFSHKDHIDYVSDEVVSTKYGDIHFAVRVGNNHGAKFDIPVVVVGSDMEPSFIKTWGECFYEEVEKVADSIISAIVNTFFYYADLHDLDVVDDPLLGTC